MTITKLITCKVLVKYLAELLSLIYGYLIFLTHAAKTSPNSHIVIAPPPVIAFIPQLHIPQFKAKKNTYIIVKTNNPS